MAFPSSIDAPGGTASQGTSLLTSPDHALDHRTLGSAVIAIENKLGIGVGSAAANQVLIGSGAGSAAWGSVWNNAQLGTAVINASTLGTPMVTGGTMNNAVFGTPNITGGTITNTVINAQADGWQNALGTLTYLAADGSTFTATSNADLSTAIGKGDKFKLTQGSTKYFIITAINTGTVTMFGGTAYTLGTAAITSPQYSHHRSPFGFPMNPDGWTVEASDTTQRIQNSPTASTWYNPGTMKIDIPIGLWNVEYNVIAGAISSTETGQAYVTLNTTASAGTITDLFSTSFYVQASTGGAVIDYAPIFRSKMLELTTKDDYFLNIMNTASGVTSISFENDNAPMVIRARSAYL